MAAYSETELLEDQDEAEKSVRFFARVVAATNDDSTPFQPPTSRGRTGRPHVAMRPVTVPLSRTRSPSGSGTSLPSPSSPEARANPFSYPYTAHRRNDDDEEDDSFTPNPPRALKIRMPTLTRRKRAATLECGARSCLRASSPPAHKAPRLAGAPASDPCPIVFELPTLPDGSPSTSYRPLASPSLSETGSDGPLSSEPLRTCCDTCSIAWQFGLHPDYTERFSASAKRKQQRDSAQPSASIAAAIAGVSPGPVSPGLTEDGDVPLPAKKPARYVDELAKLCEATKAKQAEAGPQTSETEKSEEEDEERELTKPMRRCGVRSTMATTTLQPILSRNEDDGEADLPVMRRSATAPASRSSESAGETTIRHTPQSDTAPAKRVPLGRTVGFVPASATPTKATATAATRPKAAKRWSQIFSLASVSNFAAPTVNPGIRGW